MTQYKCISVKSHVLDIKSHDSMSRTCDLTLLLKSHDLLSGKLTIGALEHVYKRLGLVVKCLHQSMQLLQPIMHVAKQLFDFIKAMGGALSLPFQNALVKVRMPLVQQTKANLTINDLSTKQLKKARTHCTHVHTLSTAV